MLDVLVVILGWGVEGWGGAGCKRFPPFKTFKRGVGLELFPVLKGSSKLFEPIIFPFCSPVLRVISS